MEIKLHYEDAHIVVAEKPFGICSQEGKGESMVSILSSQLNCKILPVHCLDTQTTGLIVYAKTKHACTELTKQIQGGVFKKEYFCICHGDISQRGEMKDFLYHDKLKNKSFVVASKRMGTKEAILEYTTLESKEQLNFVKVKLHTGRTHQIRVQFASRGNVLYGDGKYGAKDNDRIALHSCYLSITHPKTGRQLTWVSQPQGGIWDLFIKRS